MGLLTNENPPFQPSAQELQSEKVMQLLKPPVLPYIRELRKLVNEDPQYLVFHSTSVTLRVKSLLAQQKESERWSESEREVLIWIKEAIVRLRSFEK